MIDAGSVQIVAAQEKGEMWITDASGKRILCELWGPTFAKFTREATEGDAARKYLIGFTKWFVVYGTPCPRHSVNFLRWTIVALHIISLGRA